MRVYTYTHTYQSLFYILPEHGTCEGGLAVLSSEISFTSNLERPPASYHGLESFDARPALQDIPARTLRDSGSKTSLASQKRLVKRDDDAGVFVGPKGGVIPSSACEEVNNLQHDLLEDMASRAVELIQNMEVPAYAMVVQCQEGNCSLVTVSLMFGFTISTNCYFNKLLLKFALISGLVHE